MMSLFVGGLWGVNMPLKGCDSRGKSMCCRCCCDSCKPSRTASVNATLSLMHSSASLKHQKEVSRCSISPCCADAPATRAARASRMMEEVRMVMPPLMVALDVVCELVGWLQRGQRGAEHSCAAAEVPSPSTRKCACLPWRGTLLKVENDCGCLNEWKHGFYWANSGSP